MQTVERELISTLRARIAAWNKSALRVTSVLRKGTHDELTVVGKTEPDDAGTDEDEDHLSHDAMQLGILEMWLDRITAAIDALRA